MKAGREAGKGCENWRCILKEEIHMDYVMGNYRAERAKRAKRAEIGVGFVLYMSFPTRCLFTL